MVCQFCRQSHSKAQLGLKDKAAEKYPNTKVRRKSQTAGQ